MNYYLYLNFFFVRVGSEINLRGVLTMFTNAINKYSIFGGAAAGAAVYATGLYFTPATVGAITFAVSSFFLSLVGSAVAAVALGYALPILAAMIAGALLAIAINALFNALKTAPSATNSTAAPNDDGTTNGTAAPTDGATPSSDEGKGEGEDLGRTSPTLAGTKP